MTPPPGLGHRRPAEPFQLVELAASLRGGTRRGRKHLLQRRARRASRLVIVAARAVDAHRRGGIDSSPRTSGALSRMERNAVAVHSHGVHPE
jgi:hypothetical protein